MVELTKLKKKDFEKILKNYDIGKYKSRKHAWWALANTVYFLETTKGSFILKIYGKGEIDSKRFSFVIKTIDYLNKKRLPIPEIIKNKKGERVFFVKGKRAFIQRFVKGKNPKRFSDKLIKDIAKKIGFMNKYLMHMKYKNKYTWGDHIFRGITYGVKKIPGFDFSKHEKLLYDGLAELDKSKLRKITIHADLHMAHFVVKKDKLVAIIDWDDVHEDYLVYEIAVLIAHSFVTPKKVMKDKIRLFLRAYQKHVKLNKEERKALYYFVQYRYLNGAAWVAKRKKQHKDKANELGGWVQDSIKKYKKFSEMSLEDFLKLF